MNDADKWNELFPPGTPVVLTDDSRRKHETKTRSEAWMVGSRAVVLVEGRTGGYMLSRLRPVDPVGDVPGPGVE